MDPPFPSSIKKKKKYVVNVGPPLKNLSGSAHEIGFKNVSPQKNYTKYTKPVHLNRKSFLLAPITLDGVSATLMAITDFL